TSSNSFVDLFFVADEGNTVGNRDGQIQDLSVVGSGSTDAFRIDNVGLNQPLIGGDVGGDLIFGPGESWTFLVTNFGNPTLAPPTFQSAGAFAGTSFDPNSTASIVANLFVIPEPATCSLLLIGLGGIFLRRKPLV
ncbi:MAG: PEP-CTERM sorting domain-containing protein, partial [Pirellulales bacterium]|nr:PEP-CTERM sorting domain-containing protein [Pirellulales bacterium]